MKVQRRQATSVRRGSPGYTLVELLVAMMVVAIIVAALTGAFISSLHTTDGIGDANGRTADIQLLSSFFPTDAQSVAGEKVDNPATANIDEHVPGGVSTPPPQGPVCQAPMTSVGVWTFYRDYDPVTDRFLKAVTYQAEGSALTSKLVRYQCAGSTVQSKSVVAENFGVAGGDPAAAYIGMVCRGSTTATSQRAHSCRLQVRGAYDYDLTVDRRSRGLQASSQRPPGLMRAPEGAAGNAKATVTWDPPVDDGGSEIDLYELRSNPGAPLAPFSASVTSREFPGLTNGLHYRFSIRAHNANGWGPWSTDSPFVTPGPSAPAPPTAVNAVAGHQSTLVSFTPPMDNGGSTILNYELVARDTVSGTEFVVQSSGSPARIGRGASADPADYLENGRHYTVTVRAQNALGWSAFSDPSNEVTPTTQVPEPPTQVTVTTTQNRREVLVQWRPPTDDGGSVLTGYNVYASSGQSYLGALVVANPSAKVIEVPAGEDVTFTVVALNAKGASLPSSPSAQIQLKDAPGKITPRPTLTVGGGKNLAHVTWTLPRENGAVVEDYEIQRHCNPACANPADQDVTFGPIVTNAREWNSGPEPEDMVLSYRVRARNSEGYGPWSDYSNQLTLAGPAAPPAPVTATWNGFPGGARVSWTPPENDGGSAITRYAVYLYRCDRATTPPGTTEPQKCRRPGGTATQTPLADAYESVQMTTGPVTSLDVTGLENGVNYNFKVATENETTRDSGQANTFGNKSLFAASTVAAKPVPMPPTGVSASQPDFSSGGTHAYVWWTQAVQPAGVVAPASYTIEVDCSCVADGRLYTTTTLAPTEASPVLIGANSGPQALPAGVPLQFLVRGTNPTGVGPNSTPNAPLTLLGIPGAPQSTSATGNGGNGQVVVSWLPPSTNGGLPITGYRVQSCLGATCTTVDTGSTDLTYTVNGLTNGSTYRFGVYAINARGVSVLSPEANAVPSTNAAAPTIVGVEATGVSGQATVHWAAPQNGGSAITGYIVEASTGQELTMPASATEATLEGLANGVAVTFTVVATNANGQSPASIPSNPVVPGTKPGSPGSVDAFPTNVRGEVEVTWSAADDNGSAVTGYRVVAHCTCPTPDVQVTAAGTATGTVLPGLVDGTEYTVSVTAINFWGDGPTSTSDPVVPVGRPDAPTNVAATATGEPGTVTLTWTAPVATHGSPILEYVVTATPGGVVATVGDTSATITGLTDGVAVTFKVTAVNAAGSSDPSVASGSVTPYGRPGQPLDLVATATGTAGQAVLTWTPPADNGRPILDYRIVGTDGSQTVVPPGATTTLNGLPESSPISFVVLARNSAGDGPASGSSNTVIPAGRPDAPTGFDVVATGIGGEVRVTFSPSTTHGVPVTRYAATITCGGGCALDGSTRSIVSGDVITGLGDNTTVSVSVVAESSVGNSSAVSDSATTPVPASAPTLAGAGFTGLKGQVVVYWQAAADGGSTITSYEIRSKATDTTLTAVPTPCPATVYTGNMVSTPVPPGRTCITTNREALPDNTAVTFLVRAVTGVPHPSDGDPATFTNAEGWSNETIGFTTPTIPGGVPAGMTAVATGTSDEIRVTWAAPTTNGRSPIADYLIEVVRGSTVVRTVTPAPPAGTTTWVITALPDLTSGQTYTVRMKARNDVGLSQGYRSVTGVTPTP